MDSEELWTRLEPLLKRFGVEVVPGEPGGFITLPGYPDPVAGTSLGQQVGQAIDSFKTSPLTTDQIEKLEQLLDSLAKAVRYKELAFPVQGKVFDSNAFQEELRRWPQSKA